MAFDLSDFAQVRPWVYHLTDGRNLAAIRHSQRLSTAAELLERAGRSAEMRQRRDQLVPVEVDGQTIVLKDQKPLALANADVSEWSAGDFIEHLNRHVFFWPGTLQGPVKHGTRLFAAYNGAGIAILRVPTLDLLNANPRTAPLFCAFNSGAPRMQQGRRVRRGPDLFLPATAFPRRASEVVEMVFSSSMDLPSTTEVLMGDSEWIALEHGRSTSPLPCPPHHLSR